MKKVKKILFAKKGLGSIILILFIAGGYYWFVQRNKNTTPQYQTAVVEKGTIVSSISVSGTIDQSNTTSIATQVSGSVTTLNIKEGDTVTKGQVIAKLILDTAGQQ